MFKSTRLPLAIALGILFLGTSSQAGMQGYVDRVLRQLGRGLNNVIVGPLEVPAGILEIKEEEGDFPALTYGTLVGSYRCVVREVVGVFEVATFPLGFKPIVLPEFGGAQKVLAETYEPDMRQSVGAPGEFKIIGIGW